MKTLASHVLALLARRFGDDAERRWGFPPLVLGGFVDPRYYVGSCYKAPGRHSAGVTTGEDLLRPAPQRVRREQREKNCRHARAELRRRLRVKGLKPASRANFRDSCGV